MFVFFFLQSLVFFWALPTSNLIWTNLITPPPSYPDAPGWDVFAWIGFGWNFLVWTIVKVVAIFLYLFSILVIPFSVVAAWPMSAFIEIPCVIIFLLFVILNAIPLVHTILSFLGKVIHALAELVPL